MSQILPNLSLPLMQASQAQKHVTHNEALNILDTVAQLSVLSAVEVTPPLTAEIGDRYLVPAGSTGVWVDHEGAIAVYEGNAWQFISPKAGWLAYDQASAAYLHYNGTGWLAVPQNPELGNLSFVGINATADVTNRLSISAAATLYSHEGGGHQIKVNKASATDTASLLFQSNWSGRAEMGLNGSDNWSIKISADGSTWQDALSFDAASGAVTGVSVQSGPTDTTPGRLMRADYGYCAGNIVGTVAEIGGVPSGAIIESGSTVDGEYTRFANGLQICTSPQIAVDVDVSIGALFKSTTQTWTYPATFVAAPVVNGGNVSDVANLWVASGQSGIADCSAVAFAHVSTTGETFSLTAIGRWF